MLQDRAKDEAFLSLFFQEFQGYLLWVKRDLESWQIGEGARPEAKPYEFTVLNSIELMSAQRIATKCWGGGLFCAALQLPAASAEA